MKAIRTVVKRFVVVTVMVFALSSVAHVAQGQETVDRIAHKWGENNKWQQAFEMAVDAFEEKYPDIDVVVEPGWAEEKYKIAAAVGNAPDVYLMFQAPAWGAGGYLQPLDELAAEFNVQREDFVPAAWDQSTWRGQQYAIPIQVDPNFALVWHRSLFAEAGLHPDRPPETVQEFDVYFDRLTMFAADGTPERLGMTPWTIYGSANTIYTWGWLFGGEFYDYEAGRTTAHHPGIVEALEYLTGYFEQYGDAFTNLGSGIPTGNSRFTVGREAMQLFTPSATFLTFERYPELDLGVAPMWNNPEAGVDNAAWIGGYALGVTTGSGQPDAAFQLIQFLTADPEGIEVFAASGGWMPANIRAPYFRSLGGDPEWRVFTDMAVSSSRYRPAIPATDDYASKLGELFPQIIRRQMTPLAAMEELSKQIDAAIDGLDDA